MKIKLAKTELIHFVGIGGIGMSGLALIMKGKGCCWLLEQSVFEEKIEQVLRDILNNKMDYLEKKQNLKKLNYQNTWNNVNQKILNIINEN